MELRKQVGMEVSHWAEGRYTIAEMLFAADRILAIPEIAEALAHKREYDALKLGHAIK